MTTLSVPDMSCGHCRMTVENAIRTAAPSADPRVDLESRTVTLTAPDLAPVLAALAAQGYPASVKG